MRVESLRSSFLFDNAWVYKAMTSTDCFTVVHPLCTSTNKDMSRIIHEAYNFKLFVLNRRTTKFGPLSKWITSAAFTTTSRRNLSAKTISKAAWHHLNTIHPGYNISTSLKPVQNVVFIIMFWLLSAYLLKSIEYCFYIMEIGNCQLTFCVSTTFNDTEKLSIDYSDICWIL